MKKSRMKQNIFDLQNARNLVVSGDIHGDFTKRVYKCCVQYSMTDTVIIVAGDCGFGFEKPGYYENIYKRCRERLSKANNSTTGSTVTSTRVGTAKSMESNTICSIAWNCGS